MTDISELPDDALALIFEKSKSSIDYLGFQLVCSSWRNVIKDRMIRRTEHQIPMLLVPGKRKNLWQVFNPVQNKYVENLKLKIPHKRSFTASSLGWLATVNQDFTITLHKPYFGVSVVDRNQTICLPSLFPPNMDYMDESESPRELRGWIIHEEEYHVYKILLTADPVLNPKECVIVVIFGDRMKLAFIRYGRDTSWTKLELKPGCEVFQDLVYHEKRIYALTYFNKFVRLDIPEVGDAVVTVFPTKLRALYQAQRYLVTTPDGDLLQIVKHIEFYGKHRCTEKFDVWKVDASDGSRTRVKSLGDVAIFLGDNSSIAVKASDFRACQPDYIYFTHDKDDVTRGKHHFGDLGIYEVGKKRFNSYFNIDSSTLYRMPKRPIWIVPTIN